MLVLLAAFFSVNAQTQACSALVSQSEPALASSCGTLTNLVNPLNAFADKSQITTFCSSTCKTASSTFSAATVSCPTSNYLNSSRPISSYTETFDALQSAFCITDNNNNNCLTAEIIPALTNLGYTNTLTTLQTAYFAFIASKSTACTSCTTRLLKALNSSVFAEYASIITGSQQTVAATCDASSTVKSSAFATKPLGIIALISVLATILL